MYVKGKKLARFSITNSDVTKNLIKKTVSVLQRELATR
jgi:hypothetical protein